MLPWACVMQGDPKNGDKDITIHRLCLQSKDELSMFFTPGARHLGVFREKAEKTGKPLPISISISVDPAIEIAACFESPTTPLGYNELGIAGALRNKAIELTRIREYTFKVVGDIVDLCLL